MLNFDTNGTPYNSAGVDLAPTKVPSSQYHNWKDTSEGTSMDSIKVRTRVKSKVSKG